MRAYSISDVRKRYSAIEYLDYSSFSLQQAHFLLGQQVRIQALRILEEKLKCYSATEFNERINFSRKILSAINLRSHDLSINAESRYLLLEYLSCLQAWGEGIGLEDFISSKNLNLVDGMKCSIIELSILMQDDCTGCQTGMMRDIEDNIWCWHTEEDVEMDLGSRFDKLRILIFNVGGEDNPVKAYSFIYPDLLPGPAYSWREDNYVQAVDGFFLHRNLSNNVILANIICWMALVRGKIHHIEQIIRELGPFMDGYSISVVQNVNNNLFAENFEFAHDQLSCELLSKNPGASVFRVNLLSGGSKKFDSLQVLTEVERSDYEKRIRRTQSWIRRHRFDKDLFYEFVSLLASKNGKNFAYANIDVKSTMLCVISTNCSRLWISVGLIPKKDSKLIEFVYT